jgi:hypothetical protein
MKRFIGLVAILSFAVALSSTPVVAQPDHSTSDAVGEIASAAGREFVVGAKKIAVPFIVVGRTVVDGVAFVLLKGEQGVIYVAETAVFGLKYVVKGAKFILVKTAQGIRWVALEALRAAEIIFEAALEVTELIIEDVAYVLIQLEEGFVYVVKKLAQAGQIVIRGVKYVVKVTADGIVWITEQTWNAIKKGASWARDKLIAAKVRARLSAALASGSVGADTIQYFQTMSVNADASANLRRLSAASYAACLAFQAAYGR